MPKGVGYGAKALMTVADKAEQVQEILDKRSRGEADGTATGMIKRHMLAISKAAKGVGEDVEAQTPNVFWDFWRNLAARIEAGEVKDQELLEMAKEMVPEVAKAAEAALEAEGEAVEEGEGVESEDAESAEDISPVELARMMEAEMGRPQGTPGDADRAASRKPVRRRQRG